jgi:hypothetical protein
MLLYGSWGKNLEEERQSRRWRRKGKRRMRKKTGRRERERETEREKLHSSKEHICPWKPKNNLSLHREKKIQTLS